jgi:pyruvate dehydrogenase E2 component (dihydrolipoamide acetyltransferase)
MPVTVLMPALSPTMEKGKLAKWLKNEGDKVKSGDILAEIETDKATMEIEAIDEGTLGKIIVAEGTEDVLVNAPIAVILGEGEKMGDAVTSAPPPPTVPATSPVKGEDKKVSAPPPSSSPLAGEVAHSDGGGRVFASPLARRLAKEKGINISSVHGSGPYGRIVMKDVESAQPSPLAGESARRADEGAVSRNFAAPPSDASVLKLYEAGSYDLVPHDSMRKVIARRLTESKQTVPHFYVTVDISLDNLLNLRERLNMQAPKDKEGKPTWKISVNDFVIKAMAMALMKVPDANVSWTENNMVKHHHADVGVAVSIPGGLITPIVRSAELKGLAQISTEMKDFAARAKARKLKPEEYTGGSCSVSNMGMMGVKNFQAIVNPPQATILAVGAGERRPVVRGNDIVIEQLMSVTLSTDHRAVDGALGAEFLGAIKMYLEEPGLMLV